MSAVDEVQALTQSIGEHAVQAIGSDHLTSLAVIVNPRDLTARITVGLRENSDWEQRRALEALFGVQDLFFEDASMTFGFGVEPEMPADSTTQRQYQFV